MKRKITVKIFISIAALLAFLMTRSQVSKLQMQKLIDANLQPAVKQYKYMQKLLPAGKLAAMIL